MTSLIRPPRPPGAPSGPPRLWLREALAVIVPVSCAGCGSPDDPVCAGCRVRLGPRATAVPLAEAMFPVTAGLEYGGVVAALLGAAKERHRSDALPLLAPALEAALGLLGTTGSADRPPLFVAIPSAPAVRRRRGFGAAEVVLRATGRRPEPRALALVRDVADQAGLAAAARRRNLAGALAASTRLRGRSVVLVDDVVTTGSTLLEAARAVRQAGGSVGGAACVAYSVKREMTRRELIGDIDGGTDVA